MQNWHVRPIIHPEPQSLPVVNLQNLLHDANNQMLNEKITMIIRHAGWDRVDPLSYPIFVQSQNENLALDDAAQKAGS
jgi:hypothetical protein